MGRAPHTYACIQTSEVEIPFSTKELWCAKYKGSVFCKLKVFPFILGYIVYSVKF